jgi:ACS family hexuronate transporter-like MFS transporter
VHLYSHRLLLLLVITGGILNYVDRQMIAILKPLLQKELGWNDTDYGNLSAVFQFGAVAAFPFVGWLVDRLGPRTANPIAVGAWSLAAAAHAFASTIPEFMAARLALGSTEAMGTPTAIKTLTFLFETRGRSLAIGVMNAASCLGAIATPLLIPFIGLALGWRACFLLAGALGFAWCFAWFCASNRASWIIPAMAQGAPQPQVSWREIVADRTTWAIAGAKVLSDQAWWLLLFWAPDLLHRILRLEIAELGVPLAVIYIVAAIGSLSGGALPTIVARRGSLAAARNRIMTVAALVAATMPLALLFDTTFGIVSVLGLVLAAHQCFSVNLFATIADAVSPDRVGRVTAVAALCGNLGGMLLLWQTGRILSSGAGYLPVLLFSAAAYLLAPLWLVGLLRLRPLRIEDDVRQGTR